MRTDRFFLADGGKLVRPVSLAGQTVTAHVQRDGAEAVFEGVLTDSGAVVIRGVPQGRYWLQVGASWFLVHQRDIDVGFENLGRPDVVEGADGAALRVSAAGLETVTVGDDFQLVSANASIGFYSTASAFNAFAANAPAPGDAALAGAVLPFAADAATGAAAFPLVDAAQGDSFILTQSSPRTSPDGSVSYLAVSRALTAAPQMQQGAVTDVAGSMAAPPSRTVAIDYRLADFEAMGDAIAPGSFPVFAGMFLDASPIAGRQASPTPDLVQAGLADGSGNQQFPVTFGDPFPAGWTRFVASPVVFLAPFVAPDGAGGAVVRRTGVNVFSQTPVSGGGVLVAPLVSPPREVAVDGAGAGTPTFVATSAAPVVSWSAPSVGSPVRYAVRVVRLGSAAPLRTQIATLTVAGDVTQVKIPAGILAPGTQYSFAVVASSAGEEPDESQPNLALQFPVGSSLALSASISVQ